MKNNKNFIRTSSVYTLIYLMFFFSSSLSKIFAQETTDSLRANYPEYKVYGNLTSDKEEEALWEVMEKLYKGARTGDAELAASCFAADAEWTNAFGNTQRGRENILKRFQWLFEKFNFGSDHASTENERTDEKENRGGDNISVRYLGDDVAVLHGIGFSTVGNDSEQAIRKIHTITVLAKQHGKWEVVHSTIMDERE